MRQLLYPIMLMLLLSACSNGGYNTNPNSNTQTNNNLNGSTVCQNVPFTDTTCSCTDSMSCYVNGELYQYMWVTAEAFDLPSEEIVIRAETINDGKEMQLDILEYHGPGTYPIDMNFMSSVYVDSHDGMGFHTMNDDADHCPAGNIVITSDNGTYIKGSFCAILWNDTRTEVIHVKGGQFTAKY